MRRSAAGSASPRRTSHWGSRVSSALPMDAPVDVEEPHQLLLARLSAPARERLDEVSVARGEFGDMFQAAGERRLPGDFFMAGGRKRHADDVGPLQAEL